MLSRLVDCIALRTDKHSKLENFAEHSRVPVINALTDEFHPCQLLADMQTFIEKRVISVVDLLLGLVTATMYASPT